MSVIRRFLPAPEQPRPRRNVTAALFGFVAVVTPTTDFSWYRRAQPAPEPVAQEAERVQHWQPWLVTYTQPATSDNLGWLKRRAQIADVPEELAARRATPWLSAPVADVSWFRRPPPQPEAGEEIARPSRWSPSLVAYTQPTTDFSWFARRYTPPIPEDDGGARGRWQPVLVTYVQPPPTSDFSWWQRRYIPPIPEDDGGRRQEWLPWMVAYIQPPESLVWMPRRQAPSEGAEEPTSRRALPWLSRIERLEWLKRSGIAPDALEEALRAAPAKPWLIQVKPTADFSWYARRAGQAIPEDEAIRRAGWNPWLYAFTQTPPTTDFSWWARRYLPPAVEDDGGVLAHWRPWLYASVQPQPCFRSTPLETKLITAMLQNFCIAGLVGNRIYDTQEVPGSVFPSLVVQVISHVPPYVTAGRVVTALYRVQFTLWGGKFAAGQQNADALRDALFQFLDTFSALPAGQVATRVVMDRRALFPRTDGPIWQRVVDAMIWSDDSL
jgi:hypothetical protein